MTATEAESNDRDFDLDKQAGFKNEFVRFFLGEQDARQHPDDRSHRGLHESCDWRSDPDSMPAYRAEQIDEIMHALAILGEKNEEIKALGGIC